MTIEAGLAAACARAAAALSRVVPADVRVSVADGVIVLRGRALSARALVDARLRDFAGLVP